MTYWRTGMNMFADDGKLWGCKMRARGSKRRTFYWGLLQGLSISLSRDTCHLETLKTKAPETTDHLSSTRACVLVYRVSCGPRYDVSPPKPAPFPNALIYPIP